MQVKAEVGSSLTTAEYIELEKRYGAFNYAPLDVVVKEASGVWVHDAEGNKYMDCLAAYSALNQGHCHPAILETMIDQAKRVTLTSRAFRNEQLPLLCRDLHELTGMEMTLPMNSGAEAVETALKAARRWGYEKKGIPVDEAEIIVCAGNFHGRTITIVSFTTEDAYRKGFGPYTPGFKVVPYGDAEAVRKAITPKTCAFLVEPIQGEAGIIIPPKGYLEECHAACKENNVLFMLDEIQSGLGRSGKLFAYMHEDVRPDAIITGKALSGGYYPVSAVIATGELLGVFRPGEHGSTFGGNPLGCAVARTALRVLQEENLCERSEELGSYLLEKLRGVRSPIIREVRGRGLWIGIELTKPARPFCEELMREGLLCKETHDFVIRIAPPLVVTQEELDWAFERFEKVLTKTI